MADHRWSHLTGMLNASTPRQKLKAFLGAVAFIVLISLFAFGYMRPDLDRVLQAKPDKQEPEALKGLSVGQDANFMGRVVEQQKQQAQHAAAIKALETENDELRQTLQQALSQSRKKREMSPADVQKMINAQLVAARSATPESRPTVTPPPPTPKLSSKFEPPSPPPAAASNVSAPKHTPAEPPQQAVPIPAGGSAEGIALNGFLAQSNRQHESVAVELITDLTGPNEARIPMKGCRVVAECEAKDLIARGRCEITVVTCTLPGNALVDVPLSGWLTAGDNVNGTFGTVIWNNKELLTKMAEATLPGILSEILDLTDTVVTSTNANGVVISGTTSPLADIARDLSDLLLDRVRMFIFPIVAVDRNQRVNVYIRETAYATGTLPHDWVRQPVADLSPYN